MNPQGPADPQVVLAPIAYGAGVVLLLAVLFRLLQPFGTLRGFRVPFFVGAVTMGVYVSALALAARLGWTLSVVTTHVLQAVLLSTWGFVALGLAENLLLDRWLMRQGVSVPRLVRDITRAIAFLLAMLLAIRLVFPGVSLSSILISSTVLSAVIGLALQDLLKNVFSGIALQMERPFDVGHWIEVNGEIGRVTEMSWRATRMVTVDGNYLIFPNSLLAQTELNNFTLGSPLQAQHVQVNLGHEHPPGAIKRILTAACLASPDVLPEPPPSIKVLQYGDFFVTYDLKFWMANYDRYPEKRDAVMTNVWYFLHREGVRLPRPISSVLLQENSGAAEGEQHQALHESLAACIRGTDLFAVLDDGELRELAAKAQLRLYGRGEVLVRQGEPGDALFILRAGRVAIRVFDEQIDAPVTVNHLGAGEFFGELALLTGARRGATVLAEEDVEAVVIAQADIAPLLKANPALPERLGEVLADRQEMTLSVLNQLHTSDASGQRISKPTLVDHIRNMFGLSR